MSYWALWGLISSRGEEVVWETRERITTDKHVYLRSRPDRRGAEWVWATAWAREKDEPIGYIPASLAGRCA